MYTTTVGLTLEFELPALERALGLVAPVAAVVRPVADRQGRRAVTICALEQTRSADPRRTARRFVGAVLAVLLPVAPVAKNCPLILPPSVQQKIQRKCISPPVPRDALLVGWSATILAGGAVGDARLAVLVQGELVRTLALVGSDPGLAVSLEQV